MTQTRASGGGKKEAKGRGPMNQIAAGEAMLDQGRITEAIGASKAILRKDPNHLGGLELLARAYWRSGEYEQGLDALRHLIRLNPYEPGYHFMAGGAHQALGHYGDAVRAYTRCLEGESEALRRSAAAAIRELEAWQESLIAELLREDRPFRAEYARSPLEACRRHGFEFSAVHDPVGARRASEEVRLTVWERPS